MRTRLMLPFLLLACQAPAGPGVQPPLVDDPVDPGTDDGRVDWQISERAIALPTDDAGVIVIIDEEGEAVVTLDVGSRLGGPPVIRDGQVYASLRDERSVVAYRPAGRDGVRKLEEISRIEVGPEPRDLVLIDGTDTGWVAVSQDDAIRKFDFATGQIVDEYAVDGHPQWLTPLAADGELIIASQVGDRVHRLVGGNILPMALPGRERVARRPYSARVTGRPVVDADDGTLWIPVLYADTNLMPITVVGGGHTERPTNYNAPDSGGDGNFEDELLIGGGSRFMAALVAAPADASRIEASSTVILAGRDNGDAVRGVFNEVWAAPDSDLVVVAVQGARSLLAARPLQRSGADHPRAGMFDQHLAAVMPAPDGPSGMAVVNGNLYAYGQFDRQLMAYGYSNIEHTVEPIMSRFLRLPAGARAQVLEVDPELARGASLFHASNADDMVDHQAGLSCANCHAEGLLDGLTWNFPEAALQTPTLAGNKSAQEPVTWNRSVPTVADEVFLTTVDRMGGMGPGDGDVDAIVAWIDSVPLPDTRPLSVDEAAIERGAELFTDLGCDGCHSGDQLTDRGAYWMGLDDVRTPTLLGIRATAPYFHDGSAPTLSAVVKEDGHFGQVPLRPLSSAEVADLVSYLEIL